MHLLYTISTRLPPKHPHPGKTTSYGVSGTKSKTIHPLKGAGFRNMPGDLSGIQIDVLWITRGLNHMHHWSSAHLLLTEEYRNIKTWWKLCFSVVSVTVPTSGMSIKSEIGLAVTFWSLPIIIPLLYFTDSRGTHGAEGRMHGEQRVKNHQVGSPQSSRSSHRDHDSRIAAD